MDVDPLAEIRQAAEDMVAQISGKEIPKPPTKKTPPTTTSAKPEVQAPSDDHGYSKDDPRSFRNRQDMIDRILELQKATGMPKGGKLFSKTSLSAKKRDELEVILASFVERTVEITKTAIPEEKFEVVTNEQGETTSFVRKPELPDATTGAKALYSLNFTLVKVAELASINLDMKGKIGSDLKGLGEDVHSSKKELEEILGRIYKEHGPSIGKYLTPTAEYAALMFGITAQRLEANRKKNTDSNSLIVSSTTQE